MYRSLFSPLILPSSLFFIPYPRDRDVYFAAAIVVLRCESRCRADEKKTQRVAQGKHEASEREAVRRTSVSYVSKTAKERLSTEEMLPAICIPARDSAAFSRGTLPSRVAFIFQIKCFLVRYRVYHTIIRHLATTAGFSKRNPPLHGRKPRAGEESPRPRANARARARARSLDE